MSFVVVAYVWIQLATLVLVVERLVLTRHPHLYACVRPAAVLAVTAANALVQVGRSLGTRRKVISQITVSYYFSSYYQQRERRFDL